MAKKRIGLVKLSEHDSLITDLLPSNEGRSSVTRELIKSYQLDDPIIQNNLQLIHYCLATKQELETFHSKDYIDQVLKLRDDSSNINELSSQQSLILDKLSSKFGVTVNTISGSNTLADSDDEEKSDGSQNLLAEFGLIHDCPLFPFLNKYVQIVAGSSLACANWLLLQNDNPDTQSIAINWTGGRHHAHRNKASGFCYINDIVLAITKLRSRVGKVMYIDFDLHHGDGVSSAFKISDKVLCFSIHRQMSGFFPGTGVKPIDGILKGKGFDLNVPTRKGFNDESLKWVVNNILFSVLKDFSPEAIIIQCGGDGLCSDSSFSEWNLTIKGLGNSILSVIEKAEETKKIMLLGGGGYNNIETSKLWCFLSACLIKGRNFGLEMDELPDTIDTELIDGNQYDFWSSDKPSLISDKNDIEYLTDIKDRILYNQK